MLLRRVWDLHASGAANRWMRHIAIATNLIAATTLIHAELSRERVRRCQRIALATCCTLCLR